MQPAPSDREAPPLRTFGSLDENLRRERRVFTTVIVLLVCATVAASALAIRTRLSASLRREEQVVRLYDQTLADKILDRQSALTVASLILSLRANGALPDEPTSVAHPCRPNSPQSTKPLLQGNCNETSGILSSYGDGSPIEIIRIDDGTTYEHQPAGAKPAPPSADAALAHKVLKRF